ncbi:MAG: cyclic pyranopterin monophosphate synthase MoaC [Desulfobacteraceae bacterium]|nr:MAG: cyclic pyranopterin monophosphate synthase MoaC [Desulfobacteraceae bacterium]
MGMIDVGEKPIVRREAIAAGRLVLKTSTLDVIRGGGVRKGNPLPFAEAAAFTAAKQAHLLIPHCHQIPLDSVAVSFEIDDSGIQVYCVVAAHARTGVEMEALLGVAGALNTLWDMLKYLEKDPSGQYPETKITDIRVVKKLKGV